MRIPGHAFLISGGGSGLGAAVARRLAADGGRVAIADIDENGGAAVAAEIGDGAWFVRTDVTREDDVAAAIEGVCARFGALDGTIDCAGVAPGERILGRNGIHRLDTFQRALSINLVGTFNVLRHAAQAMNKNAPNDDGERGVIINTASIAAFEGQVGQVAYSASKAGIVGLTLPAARELARFGIRVMTIAPGIFDTPLLGAMPEEVRDSLGAQVPFPPRLGRPEEFARLAAEIIENPMLNGGTIRLDGAMRMAAK
ncbi:MAG TPA: SDR family NAD(P)-dependent oxidoreductase [Burkholderiales bacterium]|nr:SDR family NAD(P)-dependent oxidoreductase [Burkholderiales bacterium]